MKERELWRDGTSEEIRKREDGRGGGPVDGIQPIVLHLTAPQPIVLPCAAPKGHGKQSSFP